MPKYTVTHFGSGDESTFHSIPDLLEYVNANRADPSKRKIGAKGLKKLLAGNGVFENTFRIVKTMKGSKSATKTVSAKVPATELPADPFVKNDQPLPFKVRNKKKKAKNETTSYQTVGPKIVKEVSKGNAGSMATPTKVPVAGSQAPQAKKKRSISAQHVKKMAIGRVKGKMVTLYQYKTSAKKMPESALMTVFRNMLRDLKKMSTDEAALAMVRAAMSVNQNAANFGDVIAGANVLPPPPPPPDQPVPDVNMEEFSAPSMKEEDEMSEVTDYSEAPPSYRSVDSVSQSTDYMSEVSEDLKPLVEELKNELAKAKRTIDELTDPLLVEDARAESNEMLIETLTQRLREQERVSSNLRADLGETQELLKESDEHRRKTQGELARSEEALGRTRKSLESTGRELESTRIELAGSNSQVELLNGMLSEALANLEASRKNQKDVPTLIEQIRKLTDAKEVAVRNYESSASDNLALRSQLQDLNKRITDLTNETDGVVAGHEATWRQMFQEQEQAHSAVSEESRARLENLMESRRQISVLQQEIAQLKSQMAASDQAWQQRLDQANLIARTQASSSDEQASANAILRDTIEKKEAELEAMRQQNARLSQDTQMTRDARVAQFRQQYQRQIEILRARLADMSRRLELSRFRRAEEGVSPGEKRPRGEPAEEPMTPERAVDLHVNGLFRNLTDDERRGDNMIEIDQNTDEPLLRQVLQILNRGRDPSDHVNLERGNLLRLMRNIKYKNSGKKEIAYSSGVVKVSGKRLVIKGERKSQIDDAVKERLGLVMVENENADLIFGKGPDDENVSSTENANPVKANPMNAETNVLAEEDPMVTMANLYPLSNSNMSQLGRNTVEEYYTLRTKLNTAETAQEFLFTIRNFAIKMFVRQSVAESVQSSLMEVHAANRTEPHVYAKYLTHLLYHLLKNKTGLSFSELNKVEVGLSTKFQQFFGIQGEVEDNAITSHIRLFINEAMGRTLEDEPLVQQQLLQGAGQLDSIEAGMQTLVRTTDNMSAEAEVVARRRMHKTHRRGNVLYEPGKSNNWVQSRLGPFKTPIDPQLRRPEQASKAPVQRIVRVPRIALDASRIPRTDVADKPAIPGVASLEQQAKNLAAGRSPFHVPDTREIINRRMLTPNRPAFGDQAQQTGSGAAVPSSSLRRRRGITLFTNETHERRAHKRLRKSFTLDMSREV